MFEKRLYEAFKAQNIYYLFLWRKRLPTSALEDFGTFRKNLSSLRLTGSVDRSDKSPAMRTTMETGCPHNIGGGGAHTRKLLAIYLKFKCNWASCILSGNLKYRAWALESGCLGSNPSFATYTTECAIDYSMPQVAICKMWMMASRGHQKQRLTLGRWSGASAVVITSSNSRLSVWLHSLPLSTPRLHSSHCTWPCPRPATGAPTLKPVHLHPWPGTLFWNSAQLLSP